MQLPLDLGEARGPGVSPINEVAGSQQMSNRSLSQLRSLSQIAGQEVEG